MQRFTIIGFFFLGCLIFSCTDNGKTDVNAPGQDEHIFSLQKAVTEFPDSAVLVQQLIQAYRAMGNYDSAIALTNRNIVKDTSNAYLYNILATLYFENGDTLNSLKALQKALAIFPLPEYYVALGTIYAELKNKEALAIADTLLADNSVKNHDDAYFIKGLYYNCSNDPQKAIVELDSCLGVNYTYMYAYREKAIALTALNKNDQALQSLKRAVTLQNNYDEGYYWMGKIYEKLHQNDSAIQSYQNALLYDSNYHEAKKSLDSLLNLKSKK